MKYKNKKTFAEKAYCGTEVEAGHSQEQIERMLAQIGITDIRITKQGSDYTVEFLAKLQHNEGERKVRINLPVNTELEDNAHDIQHRKDVLFRVLFHHLKARFVAIRRGLKEFDEEFGMDMCLFINGKEQRLGDIVIPEIKRQLKLSPNVILQINKLND